MTTIVTKWRPQDERCTYCWTWFSWKSEDVESNGKTLFFLTCPECSHEIMLKLNDLPPDVRDRAFERLEEKKAERANPFFQRSQP